MPEGTEAEKEAKAKARVEAAKEQLKDDLSMLVASLKIEIRRYMNIVAKSEGSLNVKLTEEEEKMKEAGMSPTLLWWRKMKTTFPILAHVARSLFTINATSSEVERLFSRGAIVLPPRRNRLGAEKVNKYLVAA